MRYFLDTEFLEGFHKPWFGKRQHYIDLVSIGIVAEDGREYSAISSEYSYKDANPWVRENVLLPLYEETVSVAKRNFCYVDNFHKVYGKPNTEIARDIMRFVNPIIGPAYDPLPITEDYRRKHNTKQGCTYMVDKSISFYEVAQPDFFGYFSDYDWVLLASLFGDMSKLPEGFPQYCRDLKQMLDDYVRRRTPHFSRNVRERLDATLRQVEADVNFPKQVNQHNALADARWNFELFKYLKSK